MDTCIIIHFLSSTVAHFVNAYDKVMALFKKNPFIAGK
jgi:hypothetical protein